MQREPALFHELQTGAGDGDGKGFGEGEGHGVQAVTWGVRSRDRRDRRRHAEGSAELCLLTNFGCKAVSERLPLTTAQRAIRAASIVLCVAYNRCDVAR